MESLYAQTPFTNITRYLIHVSLPSDNGNPTAVVDVLRKD